MAIGTAGYTAMLCGDGARAWRHYAGTRRIVVTGAAGGVGSVAIALLAKLGYHVIASTGRPAEVDYLKRLGAAEVIERKEFAGPAACARQGALGRRHRRGRLDDACQRAVDDTLWRSRHRLWTCRRDGLADVGCPFILRGVSLIGIDSVMCPLAASAGGLAAARNRSRSRQDRGMTSEIGLGRSDRRRSAHRRRRSAWPHCG